MGKTFDVRGHRRIVREAEGVVTHWSEFAPEADVPRERTVEVATRLIASATQVGSLVRDLLDSRPETAEVVDAWVP